MAGKAKRIIPHIFTYQIDKEQNIPTRHPINPGWRAEAIYRSDGQDLLRSAAYKTRKSALREIKYQLQRLGFKNIAEVFTMERSKVQQVGSASLPRCVKPNPRPHIGLPTSAIIPKDSRRMSNKVPNAAGHSAGNQALVEKIRKDISYFRIPFPMTVTGWMRAMRANEMFWLLQDARRNGLNDEGAARMGLQILGYFDEALSNAKNDKSDFLDVLAKWYADDIPISSSDPMSVIGFMRSRRGDALFHLLQDARTHVMDPEVAAIVGYVVLDFFNEALARVEKWEAADARRRI